MLTHIGRLLKHYIYIISVDKTELIVSYYKLYIINIACRAYTVHNV